MTIKKSINDITETIQAERAATIDMLLQIDTAGGIDAKRLKQVIAEKREQMESAVEALDFETAALIRDEIYKLEEKLPAPKKRKGKPNPKRIYLDED
jgi:protein-arginine kinase activator protein McsA